jgi:predicted dehydrogenase
VAAALAAGKPVLAEKPLAAGVAAARGLVRAAAAPGAILMVAHTLRWNAVVRALRREARSLGSLRLIALNQRLESMDRPWQENEVGGGVLLNTGVHAFDLLRFFSGEEIVEVSCQTWRAASARMPDTFAAVLSTASGVLATVDNCRGTESRSGRMELVGARGQAGGDHVLGSLWRLRGRSLQVLPEPPPVPTVSAVLADFVRVARGHEPAPVTATDGLAAVAVAAACELSARLGRRVRLGELEE